MTSFNTPNRRFLLGAAVSGVILTLSGCASAPAVDAQASVQAAQAAMGGSNL